MDNFLFGLLGLLSGLIGGLFGLGGGVLVVPSLISFGIGVKSAVVISIIQMIFVSIFGSLLNFRNKIFELRWGLLLGLGGLIGGSLSPFVLNFLIPFAISVIFFTFNLFAFYKFLYPKKKKATKDAQKNTLSKSIVIILTGALVGIFASTLGIGGGLLMAPILIKFLVIDTKKVVALSLFFIVFSSLSATFSNYHNGTLTPEILIVGSIIGVFSIIGVIIGTAFLNKITPKLHRFCFASVYVISLFMTFLHIIRNI